ncbi:phosphopantetheine-binding protein [Streptomyces naphthomycinicus]|uniref:phosphopantetheine-binding protein n=1 Tax=Streptomyces naphthomycinicus TaxID=2872625 RepID=UPI001CEC00BE|nr:phosphopantetheine-binding protein [Streptomyces sp. TML10]
MSPLVQPGCSVEIRGLRTEPAEIERALREHPAVARAAVRATDGEPRRLIAFVAPSGDALSLRALRGHLADAKLVPDRAETAGVPEFVAMTGRGHESEAAWTADGLARALADLTRRRAPHTAPAGATERYLAQVWEDLLAVDAIGLDDDFFSLGGHSLLAVRVRIRLQRDLGLEVAPEVLFENSVLRDQADAVDRARSGEAAR